MKIGLFFGSFNPIHIGHTAIANYLAEYSDLDEVWFVVTPQNPLKRNMELADDKQRLKIVELVISEYKKFKVSDIEFSLSKPSYTINTLNQLKRLYPDNNFVLIMGSDNLLIIEKWKDYKKILSEFEVYVYPRKDFDSKNYSLSKNIKLIDAPIIEVSSTFIRAGIKNGRDVRFFLSEKANQYIKVKKLFS